MNTVKYYLLCFGIGMESDDTTTNDDSDTTTKDDSDSNTTTTDKNQEELFMFLHFSQICLV